MRMCMVLRFLVFCSSGNCFHLPVFWVFAILLRGCTVVAKGKLSRLFHFTWALLINCTFNIVMCFYIHKVNQARHDSWAHVQQLTTFFFTILTCSAHNYATHKVNITKISPRFYFPGQLELVVKVFFSRTNKAEASS